MSLDEAIDTIKGHDPEEVASALDSQVHRVWQEIHDDGRKAGRSEVERKFDNATSKVEDLESQLEQKEQELEALREEQPDLEDAYEKWKKNELSPVQEQLSSLRDRVRTQTRKEAEQRVKSFIEQEVGDEFLADTVVHKFNDNIEVTEDGDVKFMRPGVGMPYESGSGEDPAKLMAQDIVEEIPESYRNKSEQGGPRSTEGTTGRNGASSTSGKTRQEIASSPSEMAQFRKNFDTAEEFEEAWSQLPES